MDDDSGDSDYQDESTIEFSANDAVAGLFADGSRRSSQSRPAMPTSPSEANGTLLTKSGLVAKRSARCMVMHCQNRADGVTRWKNEQCSEHGRRKGDCPCRTQQPYQLFHLNRNTRRMTLAFCELVLPETLLDPIVNKGQNPSQHWRVCSDHFAMEQSGDKNAVPILGLQRSAAEIQEIAEKYDAAGSLPPNFNSMDLSVRPFGASGRFKIPRECTNANRAKRGAAASSTQVIQSLMNVEREEKAAMNTPGAEHDKQQRSKTLGKRKRVSQMCSVDECCVTNLTRQPRIGKLPYQFFPLPIDSDLARQWIEASKSSRQDQLVWWSRYQDALEQNAVIARYCPFHVCEKHFLDGEPSTDNPVPTLFMPKDTPKLVESDRQETDADGDRRYGKRNQIAELPNGDSQLQSLTAVKPHKCVIRACPVRSDSRVPNKKRLYRMFRMPTDSVSKTAWLKAIMLHDPNFKSETGPLADNYVCERHFVGGSLILDGEKQLPTLSLSLPQNKHFEKTAQQSGEDHDYLDMEELSNSDGMHQYQQCLVRCCPVDSGMFKKPDNIPYRFFPVPKTTVARTKWFDTLQQEDPLFKPPVAMFADDQFYLCERHFVPTSIRPNSPKTSINVVPTLNLSPATSANIDQKNGSGQSQSSSHQLPPTNRKVASYLAPHTKSRGQRRADSWCCRDIPALKYSMSKLTSRIDSLYLMICQLYTAAGYDVAPESDGMVVERFANRSHVPLPVGDQSGTISNPLMDALAQLKSQVNQERTRMDEVDFQTQQQEAAIEMEEEPSCEPDDEPRGSQRRKLIRPGPKSFKKRKIAEINQLMKATKSANATGEGPLVSVETTEGEDVSAQFAINPGPISLPQVDVSSRDTPSTSTVTQAVDQDELDDEDEQIVPEI